MIKAMFKKRPVADNVVSVPANILFNLIFFVAAACCIYPFLLVISVSFSEMKSLSSGGYQLIPRVFTADAYKYVFAASSNIINAYGVTLVATAMGTFLHLAMVSMFSYPLSRPEFEFRGFYMKFLLIPMLFSGGMVPWYIVCTQFLKLGDTMGALIVPYAFSGWNAVMMNVFIRKNIPTEMIEAARMDGSSEFKTYLRIVLPLSKAGLAAIGYMVAIGYWNDWWLPTIFIRSQRLHNLQYMLYRIMAMTTVLSNMVRTGGNLSAAERMSQSIPQESLRMAMVVIAVGPIVFAYPFFQRQFVKGLVVGSLKG